MTRKASPMTNSCDKPSPPGPTSRRQWQLACLQRAALKSPSIFRTLARMTLDQSTNEASPWQPWQLTDFAALDAAWQSLAGQRVNGPIKRRAYVERPRGHSKTTDMAMQACWILQAAPRPVQGLAAAADRDQAGLIGKAIADLVRQLPEWLPDLVPQKEAVIHRRTGSRLDMLSSDVNSSWGHLPDFVICDELCHWPHPDLWYSLCSSAAKKPACVLTVLTNAGHGTGWQWTVRETARTSPEWHFSSLSGPQAPWITPSALDEQRRLLPPGVFARLWLNEWQHSDGGFVSLAEAEACRDEALVAQTRGRRGVQYFAAIDYAEKHDRTVGVIVHREGEQIVVDRMDVVDPQPDAPVQVQWVEDWIRESAAMFPQIQFVLDEYQLLGVIQRTQGQYDVSRFDFAGGRGNHALAMTLRNLLLQRQVRWCPGCGQLSERDTRDDLETELSALIVRQIGSGRLRIDHRREAGAHDDRAFALGAACLAALRSEATADWLEIDGSFERL